MAEIELKGITHRYGGAEHALRDINLVWKNGGAYALLGPSGCGKTTMLDIISGLLGPSQGTVAFDGRVVNSLSPAERNIAQVFQFPVLYESMTVEQNLRFPLRNRGFSRAEAQKRAVEVCELLEIGDLRTRRAKDVSADAKQLVSLGRALVRTDVSAILFDEPLTVIDPQRKWNVRQALKRVHQELSHTLVYVTHDQTEALTFADEVVVLNNGEVMQEGTPDELFERPSHRFVGDFIGSPGMNILPVRVNGSAIAIEGVVVLDVCANVSDLDEAAVAGDVVAGVRPEFVRCHDTGGPGRVPATIERRQDLGTSYQLHVHVGGSAVVAKLPDGADVPDGSTCWVDFDPDRLILFRDDRAMNGVTARHFAGDGCADGRRGKELSA